ncbi:unnamed protein product [Caenorhabditis auriculariae]|uniref:Serine palmitoyltransferase 1 n=1 Tax=Caenorhabditis auriculariae TaxID=2777116 RepID=A0A8S1HLA8_9PELO|nr:unnamed protein product [Caenorhabditis auriculariae]
MRSVCTPDDDRRRLLIRIDLIRFVGVTEHFGVPIEDVDMVMGSLENALASTGGFPVPRIFRKNVKFVVSGLGYCFSASLPPLLATAASEGLKIIEEDPGRVQRVQKIAVEAHQRIQEALEDSKFYVEGEPLSPMKHIYYDGTDEEAAPKLDLLVDELFEKFKIVITRARYLEKDELFPLKPSARLMFQTALTDEEIDHVVESFRQAAHSI